MCRPLGCTARFAGFSTARIDSSSYSTTSSSLLPPSIGNRSSSGITTTVGGLVRSRCFGKSPMQRAIISALGERSERAPSAMVFASGQSPRIKARHREPRLSRSRDNEDLAARRPRRTRARRARRTAASRIVLARRLLDRAQPLAAFASPGVRALLVVGVGFGQAEDPAVVALALEAAQRRFERLVRTHLNFDHSRIPLADRGPRAGRGGANFGPNNLTRASAGEKPRREFEGRDCDPAPVSADPGTGPRAASGP